RSIGGFLRHTDDQLGFGRAFDRRFGAVKGDRVVFLGSVKVLAFNRYISTNRPLLGGYLGNLDLLSRSLGYGSGRAFGGLVPCLYFFATGCGLLWYFYN